MTQAPTNAIVISLEYLEQTRQESFQAGYEKHKEETEKGWFRKFLGVYAFIVTLLVTLTVMVGFGVYKLVGPDNDLTEFFTGVVPSTWDSLVNEGSQALENR